jgi:hypothetical protein
VQERDRLPARQCDEPVLRRRIRRGTDNGQRHAVRQSANQIGHALVRQQTPDEERAAIAGDDRVRRELLRIDAAANHARPREIAVAVNATAVLAQVQMPVEPRIRGDIRRDVVAAAPEIADEHALPGQPAPRGHGAAHEHVMLVTVHDVGSPQFAKHFETERVGALPAHEPGVPDRPHLQRADLFLTPLVSECHQRRRDAIDHLPGQLEGVPLRAANDTVGTEERGDDVDDLHRASASAGLMR